MPFKTILRQLVESIPGATGAILADWEGESVEQFCLFEDFELKVIAAHKGIILSHMKEAHSALPGEEVQDAVVTTNVGHIVTGVVGAEYSLVMTLERDAIVGFALDRFRKAVKLLEKEIY